jgi:hypothetical protein
VSLLLLLESRTSDGVAAVSGTVGPVRPGPTGFTHLTIGDAFVTWTAGDAITGVQLASNDAVTGWTTGDATE